MHMNARQTRAHQQVNCTQYILSAADIADCDMKLRRCNALMISCSFVVVRVLMEKMLFPAALDGSTVVMAHIAHQPEHAA